MEFSPVSFSSLPNQSVDIFTVTVTSSLRHAGWTAASGGVGRTAHGCLVLEQKFNPRDNPENIMSKQTQFWLSTIISAGLIPLLFLVGVPGNVLSAAVFYRQGLRERINFCVFSLALVDLVVLVVIFCLSVEKMYRALVGPFNFFIQYFVGLTGFTWVSMFLSVAIAAERCFCVVSPLHAQRVLSTRTLAIVIISVSAIILTGMLTIAGPKHTEICVFDPQSNTTSLIVYVTEYYKENKPILDIFDIFVYAMTLPVIFFVVIVITTIITAAKLRSASRWRQKSSVAQPTGSLEHHVVAVTRMLIATSVLFVLCLSPVIVVQLSIFLVPELKSGGRYHNFRTILWSSIDLLRCVNSSLNFFVYYRMGSRFRQTLKQMLRLEEDGTVVSRSDLMGTSSKKLKQSEERAVSGNDNPAYVNE